MSPENSAAQSAFPLPATTATATTDEGDSAPPPSGPQGMFAWYAPGFSDGLGDRLLLFDNTDGRPLELLRLRPDFARSPEFEAALRDRARELASFEDSHFARVCRVDRLPDPGGGLAVVSEHVEGPRLSELLRMVRQRHARLTADLALALVKDLLTGVAVLHGRSPAMVHGALAPERLVLAPGGRLLITEYVLGGALRGVSPDRTTFWTDLRIALPQGQDEPAFERSTDLLQVGLVTLALMLARPLEQDDYPDALARLLGEAEDRARLGGWEQDRWVRFRAWIDRLFPGTGASGFTGAAEAKEALEAFIEANGAGPSRRNDLTRLLVECAGGAAGVAAPPPRERRQAASSEVFPAPVAPAPALPGPTLPAEEGGTTGGSGADLLAFPAEDATARESSRESAVARLTGALRAAGDEGAQRVALARRGLRRSPTAGASPTRTRLIIGLLSLVVVLEGVYLGRQFLRRPAPPATTGSVRIESTPASAAILVDGKPAGTTPATLQLRPGAHVVELASGARRRTVTLKVEAGVASAQYVELPVAAPDTGELNLRSEPVGARVLIDGQARGNTPVVLADLPAGEHQVRLESQGRSVVQAVKVVAGQTTSLFVPFPGGDAPLPGWLSIKSPLELQVYEGEELLGSSRSERLMLPAGSHDLVLLNDAVGFRATRQVQVPVGRMASVEVSVPNGTMDINAAPWAEVWVDGERVGETPLAGVPVALGRHSVRLRHPTLGERTVETLVTFRQPARVSADLRK